MKQAKPSNRQSSSRTILLIAIFKLFKGVLLVAVGIGALNLLHKDLAGVISHWVDILRVDPDNQFIHPVLSKVFFVTPKQLKALSAGTFVYAALLFIEGTGLLMRRHWAEYFTVITTAGLIPLEIYELAKHFSWMKVLVIFVNALIVVYLVVRLRSSRVQGALKPVPAW
jgi:uncharacterized membrane protein (DUF2068 family)